MMRIAQHLLVLLLLISNDVSATKFTYIPYSPDQFISREKYQTQIHDQFENNSTVLLYGLPGIGKTALAALYAQGQMQEYALIYWIDCRHNVTQQIKEMFNLLQQKFQIPFDFKKLSLNNSLSLLYDFFSEKKQKILLVFDNCNDYKEIQNYISLAQKNSSYFLITSQDKSLHANRIEIGGFEPKESSQYLSLGLSFKEDINLTYISNMFSGYPFMLSIIKEYLMNTGTTKEILQEIQRIFGSFLEPKNLFNPEILDNYKGFLPLLEILFNDFSKKNPRASEYLLALCLYGPTKIDRNILFKHLEKNENDNLYGILSSISSTSLISLNTGGEKMSFHFHDIIHKLIRFFIPAPKRQDIIKLAIDILYTSLDKESVSSTNILLKENEMVTHAESLIAFCEHYNYSNPKLLSIKAMLFDYYMGGVRNFDSASKVKDSIKKDLQNAKNEFSTSYYDALNKINIGYLSSIKDSGYDLAIKLMKEALQNLEAFDYQYADDCLRCLTNLAQYEYLQGNLRKAEGYIQKCTGYYHRSVSATYKSLFLCIKSMIHLDDRNLEEAENALDQLSEEIKLVEDYGTLELIRKNIQADFYIKTDRFIEAEKLLLTNIEDQIKFFGGDTTSLSAITYLLLSTVSLNTQKNQKGNVTQLERLIDLFQTTYKSDEKHRLQALAWRVMGQALLIQKKIPEAFAAFLKSEKIYKAVFKNLNIPDVELLYFQIIDSSIKNNSHRVAVDYLQHYKNLFGIESTRYSDLLVSLDKDI
ncbi:MAG: ATP-binding protein [Alphaproteobacteria bacterium]|nr:ATP-binding protein [Alphaproteobacteria bacterium]NCQ67140.1 ATP-binding protein [Alphaproteobacteria bacterium]NCT07736.1 ATP-binding protein [Alphaproteobacteria bacterium]